jgi:hypothetical protein
MARSDSPDLFVASFALGDMSTRRLFCSLKALGFDLEPGGVLLQEVHRGKDESPTEFDFSVVAPNPIPLDASGYAK